jgi:hypothetical protein
MASSGMLSRVALIRTEVSDELCASFMRVTKIGELQMLAVTSNQRMLRRNFFAAHTAENPPYSCDISPCDYDLFAKMKEPLRGTRYNTREEIIRPAGLLTLAPWPPRSTALPLPIYTT